MSVDWVTTTTILHDLREDPQSAAWGRLVSRFHRPIASFAREIGVPPADADDIAQETLVAFMKAFLDGKYDRKRGRLNKWLFGIAYRQALRQREKAASREANVGGPDGTFWNNVPDESDASICFDRQWEHALLESCLDRARAEFEPDSFRAFELTVQQGLSAAEAAEAVGVNVKSVYNAKHRVLKRIRELRDELEQIDLENS